MAVPKERIPGVDLAKVVAIFFVLIHHISDCGVDVQSGDLVLSYVHTLLHSISYSCIDLFALATGFLCVNSSCRYSRILTLWVSAVFWGVISLLLAQLVFGYAVPLKAYFNALFPVWRMQYWFFTSYFMLFLFMPCLNRSVKNMTQREFQHLLVAVGVFICCYSIYSRDPFRLNGGYSFAWLCIVYLIGAYIRLYTPRRIQPCYCFSIAVLIAFLTCIRQLVSVLIGVRIPGDRFMVINYLSPFTLGVAVMILMGCINMTIGERGGRFLKAVAATTFGIYLIHGQPFVWRYIWIEKFHEIKINSSIELLAVVISVATVAFVVFSFLEHCRLKLFAQCGIDRLIRKIDTFLKR